MFITLPYTIKREIAKRILYIYKTNKPLHANFGLSNMFWLNKHFTVIPYRTNISHVLLELVYLDTQLHPQLTFDSTNIVTKYMKHNRRIYE